MLRRATVAAASKFGDGESVPLQTLAVGMAGLVLLATCSFSASPPAGPRALPGERPNILLIVTDDQRADMLWNMPSLLHRIGDRGIRFREGFVPHALCCPARASILTGNHSHTTGVWSNKLVGGYGAFDESSTLATWLDDAGYRIR